MLYANQVDFFSNQCSRSQKKCPKNMFYHQWPTGLVATRHAVAAAAFVPWTATPQKDLSAWDIVGWNPRLLEICWDAHVVVSHRSEKGTWIQHGIVDAEQLKQRFLITNMLVRPDIKPTPLCHATQIRTRRKHITHVKMCSILFGLIWIRVAFRCNLWPLRRLHWKASYRFCFSLRDLCCRT